MKKFLIQIVYFLFFSLLCYVCMLFLWGNIVPEKLRKNLNYRKGGYGHMFSRIEEIHKIKNVDILFLGSSHAYRGFDPRIFLKYGITSFNLGSSSQSPIQTNLLLKRYLDSIHPRLIVYEVYPGTFSSDGVESSLDIIANDRIDFYTAQMALAENHIKVYNATIFALLNQNILHSTDYKEERRKGDDVYIDGGFVERKLSFYKKIKYRNTYWDFNSIQFEYFARNIDLIKSKSIRLLLIQAPITPEKYWSYLNNNEFDDKISSYGAYINYNKELYLDDSLYFYDAHHLNQNGVEVFNNHLVKSINKYLK